VLIEGVVTLAGDTIGVLLAVVAVPNLRTAFSLVRRKGLFVFPPFWINRLPGPS
jgi:hypothetical protein